jgi:hypothetical protein
MAIDKFLPYGGFTFSIAAFVQSKGGIDAFRVIQELGQTVYDSRKIPGAKGHTKYEI